MNGTQAREYLKKVSKYGSVLGLETVQKLLSLMGNPQKELQAVHVAGTNGKGSTITFLQSIIMEAGYKVGRYSSPAVFDEREIIKVNDVAIQEEELAEILTEIKKQCDFMVSEGYPHPTVFEIETVMALTYFKRQVCDIVLVECGMGGATDATNVFKKVLCSVITTISLDHMKFLGDTIEKIATVKAGIIKENCPVVVTNQSEEAKKILKEAATKHHAELVVAKAPLNYEVEGYQTIATYQAQNQKQYSLILNMMGTFQLFNCATAIETALVLEKRGFDLERFIEDGVNKAYWPGRFEVICQKPLLVIDGAHNPGAVKELLHSIDLYFTNKRITFIMGVLADKDFDLEAQMIAARAVQMITVTPHNERALSGQKLAQVLSKYCSNVICADSIQEALSLAKKTIEQDHADMILAFGSLSYLHEIKENS